MKSLLKSPVFWVVLIYFLCPLDIAPDVAPPVTYVDDGVVATVGMIYEIVKLLKSNKQNN